MRKYMKKNYEKAGAYEMSADELIKKACTRKMLNLKTKLILFSIAVVVPVLCIHFSHGEEQYGENVELPIATASAPFAATSAKKDVISIPTGMVKAHPFLPYRDLGGTTISDVPNFDIVEPPELLDKDSDASKVMNTVVSGILYDKYSPSAILNIEGNDYLVKKGDVINNYTVLSIVQDGVTVKLGNNTYKAGIGEILTEGDINHNKVSNLDKKFGGDK